MNDLTHQYIREALHYDHESGQLFWRNDRPPNHFGNKSSYYGYLSRFAGNPAGYKTNKVSERTNYLQVRLGGKLYYAHRLIWYYVYGELPCLSLDHIDGNGLNNRIDNLREVDNIVNGKNQRLPRNNKSGHRGVWYNAQDRHYQAFGFETKDGVRRKVYLGVYRNKEDAIVVRKEWERENDFSERHGEND